MNEEIHKLKVVIEGNNAKLKQEVEQSKKSIKSMGEETKKFKFPSFREVIKGAKELVKQLKLAAGINVYSDGYKNLLKDISGAENSLVRLKKKFSEMDSAKRYVPTQEFKDLEQNIASGERELQKLLSQSQKLQNSGKATVPTQDYQDINAQLSEAQSRLDGLISRRDEWQSVGVTGGLAMDSVNAEIEETTREITYLKGELQDLEETGMASKPTQEFEELSAEISRTEQRLQRYKSEREQLIASGSDTQESEQWQKIQLEIAQAENQLESYQQQKAQMEADGTDTQFSGAGIKGFGSRIFGGLKSAAGGVGTAIKSCSGAFAALIQRFSSGLPQIGSARKSLIQLGSTSHGLSLNLHSLRRVLRYVFVSLALTSGARGMKAGLQELSSYSQTTNANLSNLRAGLSALQNSLGTAFAPIFNYVAPALNTLIDHLLAASNAVAQFMAALTGQSTYTIAKRSVSDFASTATTAGDAADGANESAEKLKRTLMGFDEINKLDDNTGSTGGSGGSGGGGGGSTGFETETVTNQFADLANQIKQAWADADFTEIGTTIGEKLKAGLDNIPWDDIKETARKVGKSLATLINGFVEVSGLDTSIGNTVAQLINTGVEGSTAFLTNLHWESVGSFIAGSMNSFVQNTDWTGIGTAIHTGINGVISATSTWAGKFDFAAAASSAASAINTALSGIQWENAITAASEIGAGLASGLNNIITADTFSNLGKTVAGAVNTALSGAYSFVSTADWSGWGTAIGTGINDFFAELDWKKAGLTFKTAASGILTTLRDAIKTVDWKQVGNDIASAIKDVDWKAVLDDVGSLIWAAIQAAIEAWKSSFDEAPVETAIVTALLTMKFTGLGDTLGNRVWDVISDGIAGAAASAGAGTAASTAAGGGGIAATIAASLKTAATNAVTSLGGLGGLLTSAFETVGGMATPLGALFDSEIRGYMTNTLKEDYFVNLIADHFSTNFNTDKFAESLKNRISVDDIKSKISGIWSNVKKAFTSNINDSQPEGEAAVEIEVNAKDNTEPGVTSAKQSLATLPNETDPNITAKDNTSAGINSAKVNISSIPSAAQSIVTVIAKGIQDKIGGNKKVLSGFKAQIKKFGDSITGSKTVKGFSARLSSIVDGISSNNKRIAGVKMEAGSLTNPKNLIMSVPMAAKYFTNTFGSQHADGGIYKNGRWHPVTAAASGGAFSTGQMFLAREAGPELVGTIGSSTAVMNNDQIVSSVSSGVYTAVCAAMARVGGGSGNPTFNIYVGGQKVTDVIVEEINNRTKSTGQCPILT